MRTAISDINLLGVRWGAALSVALHALVLTLLLVTFPKAKPEPIKPREIPVEIVQPPKAKKSPPKRKKVEPKKPAVAAKKTEPERAKKAEKKPPPKKPAEKPKPKAKPKKPAKADPPPKKPAPKPDKAPKPPPQLAQIPRAPLLRPKPPSPPKPKRKPAVARKTAPNIAAIPNPRAKKLVGQWVLQPLRTDLGHRCGIALLTGVMNMTARKGNNYQIEIRTTIRWENCRPEGAVTRAVLVIRGEKVFMVDGGGVLDRGIIRGNVMVLRDKYGDSVWRRRR